MHYGGGIVKKYIINGGKPLVGELSVSGAKNSVLPILAATVISGKSSLISNIPMLRDVEVMIEILNSLGAKVKLGNGNVIIDSSSISSVSYQKN